MSVLKLVEKKYKDRIDLDKYWVVRQHSYSTSSNVLVKSVSTVHERAEHIEHSVEDGAPALAVRDSDDDILMTVTVDKYGTPAETWTFTDPIIGNHLTCSLEYALAHWGGMIEKFGEKALPAS